MSRFLGLARQVERAFNQKDLDSLILFVTNACNLSCGFCCYAENLNQAKDIPFDKLIRLSQTMPKFHTLLLSGGEPFIRPKLDEIMLAFVRNNGVRGIHIPTNGWYLDRTDRMSKSFLEQEREATLTLSFSVDGLAETHDRLRQPPGKSGSFANLCKTLEHLSPWRAEFPNLRLRVNSVLTSDNVHEMRATVDFFHAHFELDEHNIEIVRDLKWLTAHHDSPERKLISEQFVELVDYSYGLYLKRNAQGSGKGAMGGVPVGFSNLMTYAHARASARIKHDRIGGAMWPMPCTAGRKIVVVDGSGSLRACEHRDEVVDLRTVDFDYQQALATQKMEEECAAIAETRCDCIHGCFVGNSLQHSPSAIVTKMLPKAFGA